MQDRHYSASPPLSRPKSFVREAMADLCRSLPVAWRLFRANVTARYRSAWLGWLWLLLPAAGTAAICGFIRARGIVTTTPTDLPYPFFVLAGVTLWQVFLESLQAPLQQLRSMRSIITRTNVPHEAVIGAGILELLLNAAVRLLLLAVAMVMFRIAPSPSLLLVPFGVLTLATLGVAIGLIVAPIGMLWDDVGRGIAFAATVLFFLTPAAYPLPPSGLLRLNPVSPLLDSTRAWIGGGSSPWGFAEVAGGSFVLLLFALLFYRLAQPHFVARLG